MFSDSIVRFKLLAVIKSVQIALYFDDFRLADFRKSEGKRKKMENGVASNIMCLSPNLNIFKNLYISNKSFNVLSIDHITQ